MARVYIAGPMAKGLFSENMRMGLDMFAQLVMRGHHPYLPHLSWFVELVHSHPVETWLDIDRTWLYQCEALYRLPGASVGADLEVKWATECGMAVYNSLEEVPYIPVADRPPPPAYRPLGG